MAETLADVAKNETVPGRDVAAPALADASTRQEDSHDGTAEHAESTQTVSEVPETQTVPSVIEDLSPEGHEAESEDIFYVRPSHEETIPDHATHTSIVELLQSEELPQAPVHGRSPSPLAPEGELHHDISLAMEPAPLLHRHDHHHNIVVEESHKIHDEKRESFTSAIAAVHETPSSNVGQSSINQQESNDSNGEVNDTAGLAEGEATLRDGIVDDAPNLPAPPPLEPQQVEPTMEGGHPDDDDDPLRLSGPFNEQDSGSSTRMFGAEVYVEIPILDRSQSWHSEPSDVQIEVEQRSTRPTTPVQPSPLSVLSADPTRHHHGPVHSASFSSIRSADLEVSGSPAAHTRSQCHYHKIRFGRGVFSHVLLIPHCSIGAAQVRERIGATDLGRVTKEEMLRKRDLDLGETSTNKMTSDVETLPEELEHQVKQLAGTDLLREGHIWLLPLADIAPSSMVNRTLQNSDDAQEDDVFHVRSSPRISNRAPFQTPDRKRKRASSRGRSSSATRSEGRSEGGSPESASMGTRSRARAAIVRKVSQIDEKDEDVPESKEEGQAEGVYGVMGDSPVEISRKEEDTKTAEEAEMQEDTAGKDDERSVPFSDDAADPARPEKRSNDDIELDGDEPANKKRKVEGEDGEGADAVNVKPQKAGWLSWIWGRR